MPEETMPLISMMAGSGDFSRHLHSGRHEMLLQLHYTGDIEELASRLEMKPEEVQCALQDLASFNLVKEIKGRMFPNFLIVSQDGLDPIIVSATEVGKLLAQNVSDHWNELQEVFVQLQVKSFVGWDRLGLMIVGSELLDSGMLRILYEDGTLMGYPPARGENEHYHAFMIHGSKEYTGKYGERGTRIGWKDFHHVTFGRYYLPDGIWNQERADHERAVQKAIQAVGGPEQFVATLLPAHIGRRSAGISGAEEIDRYLIPFLPSGDVVILSSIIEKLGPELLRVLKDQRQKINAAFETLRASSYCDFAEFFCWYYHLVYAEAIDNLVAQGLLVMPPTWFEYMIVEKRRGAVQHQ